MKNYELCTMEVVGSPIFVMKYCSGSSHLEVQILGDKYGKLFILSLLLSVSLFVLLTCISFFIMTTISI